jgi:predicted HTH domain antitoxin
MNTISLEINVPSDLPALLRVSQQELAQEVQRWTALELFRSRKISAGKAAEVAGVSRAEFMEMTRQHRVIWADYTDEELETELREAVALGETIHQRVE